MEAEPGQFIMAWLPGIDEKPFSLVASHPVTLTVARVGPFTQAIHDLSPGDNLWIRGPLGTPFTLPSKESQGAVIAEDSSPETQSKIGMVAGGYGVAPLYFLAKRAVAEGWQVSAIIGARTAQDIVFLDRFQDLGARVVVTTDDGSVGRQGLATQAAADLLDEGGCQALYACGPEPMLDAVERLARTYHLPAQLSYERYMRCGFGVCGSCAHQGWLVCRDGPVLSISP
jgi:dihydroorotate dehydrogenase electron transfer subunit